MSRSNKFVTGLFAGAIVGAVAGLIMAPKPGRDTRDIVGARSIQFRNRAEYYIGNLKERFKKEPVGEAFEDHSENGVQN